MSTSDEARPARPASYPDAERLDLVEELHGHRIADPYRWLEDVSSPTTERWSTDQDTLFAAARDGWFGPEARETLETRLGQLADAGYVSAPTWRGTRRFLLRRRPGQDHNVLLYADSDGKGEQVLIDPAALDPSGSTTLDGWQPSHDGKLLAYLLSEGGTEESLLRVIDVETGDLVDGPIDRARYTPIAWLPDGRSFYYVRRLAADQVPEGESQYHRRVFLHRLGQDVDQDVLVFGEGLEKTNYYDTALSRDGRWLRVGVFRGTAPRNDLYVADLTAGPLEHPEFVTVQEGEDVESSVAVGRDGLFYVFTDRDAPNTRLCVTEPDRPTPENWRDVVPQDPEAVLQDYAILDGPELDRPLVLALHARHGVSELSLFDPAIGERVGTVATPGDGTIGGLHEHPEGGPVAWFGYTDHSTPDQVYRFDGRTGAVELWAPSPGDVKLGLVHVRREQYTSKDGTRIHLTILAPSEKPDQPRPTILYGYGGFDISLTPAFSALRMAWVEAGGVFAVANLRGGGEEGEQWHRAGMFGNKQNVFDDFHAAGDFLVEQGWSTREQLGIFGGSNGGLLVGATLTQRPDAYAAVVCSAPLLDMLRYELFGLGATWNVEYGSAQVPEEFEWLLGYSPYHNVRDGAAYPATLFTIFEGDTRVDPLHARKLAAALQHATAAEPADRPILVRREVNVGHSQRAVSRSIPLWADQLGFFAHQLGLATVTGRGGDSNAGHGNDGSSDGAPTGKES
ncbi:prolyl oligopeptidase family serine peptidase [Actinospica robiniae]|uniref:prolyl oligopeptidase family serine peptidase n=1 Tax=Actinospica robiniae TaxID=304901 RepID=UPI00042813EE|nr:prolyl oligopeptidase family serine peptidase [Actinospica robiniae]